MAAAAAPPIPRRVTVVVRAHDLQPESHPGPRVALFVRWSEAGGAVKLSCCDLGFGPGATALQLELAIKKTKEDVANGVERTPRTVASLQ